MDMSSDGQDVALFGGDVPPHIRALIEIARGAPRERAAGVLWTALALAPDCLSVYYLVYKLHAAAGQLDRAEYAARLGLAEAGAQTGLPTDLSQTSALATAHVDFQEPGAARFWLFTLKALAFIRARQGDLAEARMLLAVIEGCDRTHGIGSDVTAALLEAVDRR